MLDLNLQQKEAVEHINGPLLVIAGAGSGKTRVVTERICRLIEKGVPATDILAVTFTNKAAKEMKARVLNKVRFAPLISTFHSLGSKILREKIHLLGYQNNFTIYDEEDSFKLLKTCLKTLGLQDSSLKEMKTLISKAKNNLSSESFISSLESKKQAVFQELLALYQNRLKEYNAVDFDDLLYLTVKLLSLSKETRAEYQKRWQFILIDEYQDTNLAQYELTKLLSFHQNIFAVGDPDQSIYSWRGAQYQNILNFEKDFPGAKVITLEENYRSTNTILQAANSLIAQNENRKEKKLFSQLGEGEKISLFFFESEKEEAKTIVEKIFYYYTEKSMSLNNMVIFYRTNAQSRIFEDLLLASKIPYVIYGGVSFYQRKEIKDLLAYLKLVISDSDLIAFARTINLPKRGLGKTSLEKLTSLAEETKAPILKILKNCLENPATCAELSFGKKQQNALQGYLSLIENLKNMHLKKEPLFEIIAALIRESNYLEFLKEDADTFAERKENIDELIAKAAEYEENNPDNTLEHFLEELSLLSNLEKKEETQSLKLMSLHNGKGLEFDLVFIAGLEEDLFPHINSKDSLEELEEERRLFYVGITRARKKLFLSSVSYRYLFGSPKMMLPSRFLGEIPEEFIEKTSSFWRQNKSFSWKFSDSDFADEETEKEESYIPSYRKPKQSVDLEKDEKEETEFMIGDKVRHPSFGIGTIERIYNSSFGTTFDVFFQEEKQKRSLAAKYAKLQALNHPIDESRGF